MLGKISRKPLFAFSIILSLCAAVMALPENADDQNKWSLSGDPDLCPSPLKVFSFRAGQSLYHYLVSKNLDAFINAITGGTVRSSWPKLGNLFSTFGNGVYTACDVKAVVGDLEILSQSHTLIKHALGFPYKQRTCNATVFLFDPHQSISRNIKFENCFLQQMKLFEFRLINTITAYMHNQKQWPWPQHAIFVCSLAVIITLLYFGFKPKRQAVADLPIPDQNEKRLRVIDPDESIEPPSKLYVCPITWNLIDEPVFFYDRYYEATALHNHLKRSLLIPHTNQPITHEEALWFINQIRDNRDRIVGHAHQGKIIKWIDGEISRDDSHRNSAAPTR